jgi:hypothetical protein
MISDVTKGLIERGEEVPFLFTKIKVHTLYIYTLNIYIYIYIH